MKTNEKGVGAILIVLSLLVVALTVTVGWLVYDNQKSNNIETTDTNQTINQTQATDNTSTVPKTDNILSNKYFSISLPENWVESPEIITISADDKYIYINKSEDKKLVVFVNPGGFGPNNDSLNYKIINNKIELELNSLVKCTESPPCSVIKNRIDTTIYEKGGNKIKGNAYIFIYRDNKSDSQESLNLLTTILSSMEFK